MSKKLLKLPPSRGLYMLKAALGNVGYIQSTHQRFKDSSDIKDLFPSDPTYVPSEASESDVSTICTDSEDSFQSDPTYVPSEASESDVSTICTDSEDLFQSDPSYVPSETSESDASSVSTENEIVPDSCDSDSDSHSIVFPAMCAEKSSSTGVRVAEQIGKNKWDKKHSCKFCQKLVNKMSTHLQRVHAHEPEVASAMKLPKKSKERRQIFVRLLNDGDFHHNYQVLRDQSGVLIPKYRKPDRNIGDLVACRFCKAMYRNVLLSKHTHKCEQNPDREQSLKWGECSRLGKLMMPVGKEKTSALYQNVLARMRDDSVSKIVKGDSLIILFGERMYAKRDVEEHTRDHVSARLRELGRLVMLLMEKSHMKVTTLTSALDPSNFDLIIACVREMGSYQDCSHTYLKGTLALKIGYTLKKCCRILESEGIKNNDDEQKQKARRFSTLIDGDWYDSISAAAAQSITRARMNQPRLLPSLKVVEKVIKVIDADMQSKDYAVLAKAALAAITVFNRKRGGELQRMKLADFFVHQKTNSADEEILAGLSNTEQKLVQMLSRMEIRGKLNRPVPILLTPGMVLALERLIHLRRAHSIESPYLFATPAGDRPYRGHDVLRMYAGMAGVEPTLFTATNLRKQLATLSQAMELSKLDQDQLATFLGHDIRIHRSVYRRPIEVIQKAKVASILFKLNQGFEIPDNISEEYLADEKLSMDTVADTQEEQGDDPEFDDLEDSEGISGTASKTSAKSKDSNLTEEQDDKVRNDLDIDCENSDSDIGDKKLLKGKKMGPTGKGRMVKPRKMWSAEEISAVKKHLSDCLQMNRVPKKHEAERALAADPLLRKKRTWKDVKYFVYNRLQKIRK